jgi:transposase
MLTRTKLLQELRKMRFEEAYEGWTQNRFTQEEAARLLGVSDRSFRRYLCRYKEEGLEGLIDKRLEQISHRRAPVDEIIELRDLYQRRYFGWNVKHFFSFYKREHSGKRSYMWVKKTLQNEGLVTKCSKRGAHRRKRDRAPLEGMMLHQDGSDHEWVPGQRWDLIVTMDDATNEHYSMIFVEEEGTVSSFQGMKEVILKKGLCCSMYTDRGSHYWFTPEVGGKVDRQQLTQFGRAMHQLGIEMIPAYSPEARGRSERMFRTHQERLTKELALQGITDIGKGNEYLSDVYMAAFNAEFAVAAPEKGSAFVPWLGSALDEILCERYERTVSKDNCVRFEGLVLQIPKDQYRCHYVKAKVRIHRYVDGEMAIFHGPRKLADYDSKGKLKVLLQKEVA